MGNYLGFLLPNHEKFRSVFILTTLQFAYREKDPVMPVRVEYGSRSSIDVIKVAEPLQVKSDEIYVV